MTSLIFALNFQNHNVTLYQQIVFYGSTLKFHATQRCFVIEDDEAYLGGFALAILIVWFWYGLPTTMNMHLLLPYAASLLSLISFYVFWCLYESMVNVIYSWKIDEDIYVYNFFQNNFILCVWLFILLHEVRTYYVQVKDKFSWVL